MSSPLPADGQCGDYDTAIVETVSSDIGTNPYMDSRYGGPTAPASNVDAPDEVIHVTDIDCGPSAPRSVAPTLPESVPPEGSPAASSVPAGDLPPSIDASNNR